MAGTCYPMCMPTMTRRLQILLDEERHTLLEREAERTGASIAALIRDAIDRVYRADAADRRAAFQRILDAEPMPVEDWDVMKRDLRDSLLDRTP